jgi:hypothetical protein
MLTNCLMQEIHFTFKFREHFLIQHHMLVVKNETIRILLKSVISVPQIYLSSANDLRNFMIS